jgi:hypothetical protein
MTSKQLSLPLGRPSEPQNIWDATSTPGFSHPGFTMMSSTTWMLRKVWADDYLDRIMYPDREPLTVADCVAASGARHAWEGRFMEWRTKMLREKRGKMVWTSEGGRRVRFQPNEGEQDWSERFWPKNAKGDFDGRLMDWDCESRVPVVNVDGEVYRAGERGNDRKIVIAEIMGTAFTPSERKDLLERIDSPETWDSLLCHRMLRLDDLGPETERMIREENLSERSRENLLDNLKNMRLQMSRRGA